jgi:hypothetical protein
MAGTWVAKAIDAQLGFAQTGTEQVAVLFEIREGEQKGQRMTWFGFFTERAAERTLESLRNAGWQSDDLSDLSTVGSRDCQIVVEEETDQNGQPRDRVRWVNSLGPGRVQLKQEMSADQKRAFAARMRGLAVSTRLGNGGGATTQPKRAPIQSPDGGADDIPF